ncbi:hypothetical protein ARALYDRAFT_490402 [Arabidopsis lyrata subsp. lyrata]|uniref:Uncharacterized protein n=1 Tax=Arabidopsis lyrata subsp. lyrata TaxID=81972 RepID=D7M494_ARALL|nr:uncharacterized protein LOC9311029 [Arabidopsis lyrata subsp. lyrata]EFH49136.1 hypothetical protein ARALYDRAFT_490402 [Arabidopsis lyrata subsp. lyrata]|eukprot:XP_020875895.1 uncharacterized protein LOC9311029 [Arabidopsis lyrata subsp. lyrata]
MAENQNQFCRKETDPSLSAQAMGEHQRIETSGLAEVTDPSQLPMELQEEYILGHQHQHFSMEQQQNQITGQATHLSSQLPVMMNQAVDEPHYCHQPYHQNNDLSVVPMETQQQDNVVGNLASQLQLEEQDNVPVVTMNQTTEQQQPCEQATTHNELIEEMDPEIASLLLGQNTTEEDANFLATLGNF